MKYQSIIFFISTFFLSYVGISQEIVDSTKMWSSLQEHCLPEGTAYTTDYHKFYGDTLINDTLYKKVWISQDENHENWYFFGSFIREENKRVYYREMFLNEGLIYDFNMNLGDSVLLNNSRAADNLWLTLSEIDSVETYDGWRQRWKLTSSIYLNADYWIKGIGSENGVLNSGASVFGGLCGNYVLLCQHQDENLIYQNQLYEECFYELLATTEEHKELDIFKYSYSTSSINLKFNSNTRKHILLVSASGKIIVNERTTLNNFKIENSKFSSGIYFIRVSENGRFQNLKVFFY